MADRLLHRCLSADFSAIEHVVYFTANVVLKNQAGELTHMWSSKTVKGRRKPPSELLVALRNRWFDVLRREWNVGDVKERPEGTSYEF